MQVIQSLIMSGREVFPLVEGGKGISVSNGQSAGAWAAAGGIGTFSAVNADSYDKDGRLVPYIYKGRTRRDRHEELVALSINGGINQARIAHEMANGNGRLHMNVLWEMAAVERILEGVLEGAKGLVHGVTCGAGMPYKLAQIAAHYKVYYYPIVSSARAFNALWKRSYSKVKEWLGGVVYEDPWLAGGHNGLSNSEDPTMPAPPYPRVKALRETMREFGLDNVPIIMAGGVWYLREWLQWIGNPEIGPIAFQFGTRPLLTQESPISKEWKQKLLTLKKGDIRLNKFSPTGFYSSAVYNSFLRDLEERSHRQVTYSSQQTAELPETLEIGVRKRKVYIAQAEKEKVFSWINAGFTEALRTPDSTLVFVTPDQANIILEDQINCMGCLSACRFSNWSQDESGTTGKKADPRSFCIQKSLQSISHGGDVDHELMFAGHGAYRFGEDPFYARGFIPTVKQLVERILTGD